MADQTVRAITTDPVSLFGEYTTTDGVALAAGDLVLTQNQPSPIDNRLWTVSASGWGASAITYTDGMDVRVLEGNNYRKSVWVLDVPGVAITPGSTSLVWKLEAKVPRREATNGVEETTTYIQLPQRPDVQGTHENSSIELTDRGVVDSIAPALSSHLFIVGLDYLWISATQLGYEYGAAWVADEEEIVYSTYGSLGIPTLTGLSANTLYYLYLYKNPTSGVGDIEWSATAPQANLPFPVGGGTYVFQKGADATRRYLGAFRTNGSGTAYTFRVEPYSGSALGVWYLEDTTASPFRVVSGSSATTNTTVNLGPSGLKLVPPTCRMAHLRFAETGQPVFYDNSEASTNPAAGTGRAMSVNRDKDVWVPLDASQSFRFAHTVAGGNFTADMLGYVDRR